MAAGRGGEVNWQWLLSQIVAASYKAQVDFPEIGHGTYRSAEPSIMALYPLADYERRKHTYLQGGVMLNANELPCTLVLWQQQGAAK